MSEPIIGPAVVTRCPRCGTSTVAGDRFCTTCGEPLASEARPAVRPTSRRGGWLMGAAVAVVVVLVLVILWPRGSSGIATESGPAEPSGSALANPSSGSDRDLGTSFGTSLGAEDALCAASRLECLTLEVPADQADPSAVATMEVRFGIHRADDDRRTGTLVIATGGPGTSGIELAPTYLDLLPGSIIDRYDVVFLEQRGVGGPTAIACADTELATPAWSSLARSDPATATTSAREWVVACLEEAELEGSSILDQYATFQAAADLDAYLDHIEAGEVILFGESYGTGLVQVYASHRPERVSGMVLDAVVDPSLEAVAASIDQTAAFSDVLDRVLEACDDDPTCADDFGATTAGAAWDDLADRLTRADVVVEVPSRGGTTIDVTLGLDDLVSTSARLLYDEFGRAVLLRTLAWAAHDDLQPLARIAKLSAGLDPETNTPLATAPPAAAAYFAIDCQSFPAVAGPAVEQIMEGYRNLAADGSRMAPLLLQRLPCVTGFAGEADPSPTPPEVGTYPALVLTSTADPATPSAWAEAVADRLPNGYLIVTTDSSHGTFGWGLPCPDDLVTDFLLLGDLPDERRVDCEDGHLVAPFQPLPLANVDAYADVLEALVAVEQELYTLPDYAFWDGAPRRMGCQHGGWLQLSWVAGRDTFELHQCELLAAWPLDGEIKLGPDLVTTMTLDLPNGSVTYTSTAEWSVTVEGTLDGEPVEMARSVRP